MTKQIASADEIQKDINDQLQAAGLGDTYRVGKPVRLVPPTPDGHNWHFLDLLSGDVEQMAVVTRVLSDARGKYALAQE
ncbi:MAG: hypothetical protein ACRYHA_16965 [Janthinobacterium lividum]